MSVYVDDMKAPFGRMIMCHLVADTSEELLAMIEKLEIKPKWIQHAGTPREHFDICQKKRALAVKFGAIELTQRELAFITRAKMFVAPTVEDSSRFTIEEIARIFRVPVELLR